MQIVFNKVFPALGEGFRIELAPLVHLLNQCHQAITQHDLGALQFAHLVGHGFQVGLHAAQGFFQACDALKQMLVEIFFLVVRGSRGLFPALVAGHDEQPGSTFEAGLPITGIPGQTVLAV